MFTPRRSPLKEGRSHPGLLQPGPLSNGRSRASQKQALLVVLVILCIPLFYFMHSSGKSVSVPGGANSRTKNPIDVKLDDKVPASTNRENVYAPSKPVSEDVSTKSKQKVKPLSEDSLSNSGDEAPLGSNPKSSKNTPKQATLETDDDDVPVPKQPSKAIHRGPKSGKWSERPKFEKALEKVIKLLPDEVHMRELTREVDSTGKERLREMGLRTSQYQKYFAVWEELHLAEDDEGSVYVRDDVMQYLRNHAHAGGSEGENGSGIIAELGLAQTIRSYEAYRSFIIKFSQLLFPWTTPYFSDHMSLHAHFKKGGRGIVLTAGDDQAPYLMATIYSFRKLGCDLPIEVMYLGDQDLGEDYRAELEAMDGVVTRDIAQMVDDDGWRLAGWAAKPFAILLSSFREVIFIDADSLFFRNPEQLFDDPGYKETGALFFKDRLIMPESKKRWLQQILPKPIPKLAKQSRMWTGESGHMQESGVVVVDKWQHFIALLLITRMNGPDRDGNKDQGKIGVYDMVYGDKETFWIGWLLAGDHDYHFHDGDAGIMGVLKEPERLKEELEKSTDLDPEQQAILLENLETQQAAHNENGKPDNYTICAPQLLHLDTQGKPLWFNGWILANKYADRGKKAFAEFNHYLIEPRETREPGAWQLAESNMCCLTTDPDKTFEFDDKERATLQMILDRAKEVGAYGNQ